MVILSLQEKRRRLRARRRSSQLHSRLLYCIVFLLVVARMAGANAVEPRRFTTSTNGHDMVNRHASAHSAAVLAAVAVTCENTPLTVQLLLRFLFNELSEHHHGGYDLFFSLAAPDHLLVGYDVDLARHGELNCATRCNECEWLPGHVEDQGSSSRSFHHRKEKPNDCVITVRERYYLRSRGPCSNLNLQLISDDAGTKQGTVVEECAITNK